MMYVPGLIEGEERHYFRKFNQETSGRISSMSQHSTMSLK